jgi:hypothetical protein
MLLNLILMMIGKKLLLLLMFISLVSFGQDKFTGLGGYLTVTENNVWIFSYQNNEYKQLKDRASIAFDNKNDVEEFINNYIDCISNIKTIENVKYTISSTKKMITIMNKNGQYTSSVKKYTKKAIKEMQESLKFME